MGASGRSELSQIRTKREMKQLSIGSRVTLRTDDANEILAGLYPHIENLRAKTAAQGAMAVAQSLNSPEWNVDLLFKKPWTLSKKAEFTLGAGPEWVHTITARPRAGFSILRRRNRLERSCRESDRWAALWCPLRHSRVASEFAARCSNNQTRGR